MHIPLLEVIHLKVNYGKVSRWGNATFCAVNDVSFQMDRGETVGLVGESGSGKSSIARAILKLAPVSSGEIIFDGCRIESLSNKIFRPYRKRIQMVFQDPYHTLNPRMTIGTILEEPLLIHFPSMDGSERKDRILQLLNQVGLSGDSVFRYPHQFSGGQRQRIGIARAMAVEPELLICDEAVSALDVSVQAQIINLLQDLQEENGFACLFIGHDLAVVQHISDRVIVMQNGKIVESGTTDEIYDNCQQDYTQKLLDAVPKMDWKSR